MARLSDSNLETSLRRTERTYVKLWLILIGALCLLVTLLWGGHRSYIHWQERKLMRQAYSALDRNDLRWAVLAAQRALTVDPESSDACRVLAAVTEKQNLPEAIDWRRRVVALEPSSMSDRIALVETALRFRQQMVATETLAQVPTAQQDNALFQSAAAHLALTKNERSAAEQHFEAAARLAPNDARRQLELAEFRLRSDDPDKRESGRMLAQQFKTDAILRLDVFHILINDAIRSQDRFKAVALAKELDSLPEATMTDRLLVLSVLQALKDPAFSEALTNVENESMQSADKAVSLITWMDSRGLALLAVEWSKRLPAEMFRSVPLRLALADAYLHLRDWAAVNEMVQSGSWERSEPVRRALQARVARETGDEVGFEKNWAGAVGATENDPARLNLLQTIAFQWKWSDKATAVLWIMAENRDAQRDALQTLYRYYTSQRDTAGLYRTLSRLVAVMPGDPAVRNNFSQIALLLKVERVRACGMARDLHEAHPHDAAYASTYAFGLFQSGDVQAAIKTMSQLTPEQLHEPAIAAYYGIFLATAGRTDAAREYFELAQKAKLLPEEQNLVAQAKATLARQ